MIAFLADHNFSGPIQRGLIYHEPSLSILRTDQVSLEAAPDPDVLEFAAAHGRVMLTHDKRTMVPFANARVAAGLPMPGVFFVSNTMPIGQAIDEILLAAHCYSAQECENKVRYFPM